MRSSLPPEQMENALRATVRSIDPLLPLTQVQTMEQAVSLSEAPRRFNTVLIGSFAFAAVLLAVLGIYSVISFSVASRVQEMAIRMALGSQRGSIVRLVLKSGAKLAVVGCVIGLGGCNGGFEVAAVAFVRGEPVRSAGVVRGSVGRVAAGRGRFRAACAARCVHRSHARAARRIARIAARAAVPGSAKALASPAIQSRAESKKMKREMRSAGRALHSCARVPFVDGCFSPLAARLLLPGGTRLQDPLYLG